MTTINDRISAFVDKKGLFSLVKFNSTGMRKELIIGEWNPEYPADDVNIQNLANDLMQDPEVAEWCNSK